MHLSDISSRIPLDDSGTESDKSESRGGDFTIEPDVHPTLDDPVQQYTSSLSSSPFSSVSQDPHFQQQMSSSSLSPFSSVSQENLIAMLQQQQAMLQQVLEGQKLFERRQDYFDDQLADLASKVERPIPTTPSSSSSEGKRKRVVTRTLSVSLTIMLAMYAILVLCTRQLTFEHHLSIEQGIRCP